ncbi:hypothetical protein E3J38_04635 [candidate division TA06 bacterium]|uniref:Uncharacterized protein n=1 Tax=candidate division TA06 bacterium TaxID=2250710 RepID=A0A523XNZ5_UNCT6|nr:MAG: hypothetical protein E3J38_04635 [candidate division TA06 bacterium]
MVKFMPVFMIIAALSLIAGMILRVAGLYAPLDITPNALLRFTDTMLFFAIALGLYFMSRQKTS